MLVWKAMPSMTPMMSAIFFELSLMEPMVLITLLTTSPPLTAISAVDSTSLLAWWDCSAFCLTVLVSSSIELAVSSRLEACDSVRAGQVGIARGNLPGAYIHQLGRFTDLSDQPFDVDLQRTQRLHQVGQFLDAAGHDAPCQVAWRSCVRYRWVAISRGLTTLR